MKDDTKKSSGVKVCKFEPTDNLKMNRATIDALEKRYRIFPKSEMMPFARNTPFREIAENVIPDQDGPYKNSIYHYESKHSTTIGVNELGKKTKEFLEEKKKHNKMDILSISTGMDGDKLSVRALIRHYGKKIHFEDIYDYIGETRSYGHVEERRSRLLIPEGARRTFEKEELRRHSEAVMKQKELFDDNDEVPVLNRITDYVPVKLEEIDPRQELVYDLRTRDMQIQLNTSYKTFISVFNECMNYVTTSEKNSYYNVLREQMEKKDFFDVIEAYVQRTFVKTGILPMEDIPALIKKLDRALFELYLVQDLIDDPRITDIKITDPYSMRVRIGGKAYLSNISFIDAGDYFRFVHGVAVMNNIDLKKPTQTFTDEQDENYILRFSLTAPYITSTGYPIVHIRKIARKKMMGDDLIAAGMFDKKIMNYLMDCGKYSSGVVFAGPPGSGKTTCMNWFLEDAYESSAEILVIQENDELFSYRKGVMFEHVVMNPQRGEEPCSLEKLGEMALVAGANVFVIGEAKGAEICSAITLSNSGCRTAITIHAQSSTDTIDKMVDLALRGLNNTSYDQAKRMIKSFQTIVYLEDFKVKEITEIVGYDEQKKDMIYKMRYRREDNS